MYEGALQKLLCSFNGAAACCCAVACALLQHLRTFSLMTLVGGRVVMPVTFAHCATLLPSAHMLLKFVQPAHNYSQMARSGTVAVFYRATLLQLQLAYATLNTFKPPGMYG